MVYVVDYDIPTVNPTRRVDFYRKVHRLFREHYGNEKAEKMEFSSQSFYFTTDEAFAKKFLELASGYSKRCNLYKAVKVQ
ncbi:MAG TPA: hypothetical protein VEH56_00255 [Candidatus Saccharimonadales bacterium]|nr:hypothetical protein [Candidatus Saccharimonadales bacterium]